MVLLRCNLQIKSIHTMAYTIPFNVFLYLSIWTYQFDQNSHSILLLKHCESTRHWEKFNSIFETLNNPQITSIDKTIKNKLPSNLLKTISLTWKMLHLFNIFSYLNLILFIIILKRSFRWILIIRFLFFFLSFT